VAIGVTAWVWEYSWSRHSARLVLLAIADCGEVATITVAELVQKTLISERAVQIAVRDLVALGELAVEYSGAGNRYRVLMPHMIRPPIPEPTVRIPVPDGLRFFVFRRDGYRCQECGSTDDLTLDHIYPQILGGAHTEDNLRALCRSCNSRKGARV